MAIKVSVSIASILRKLTAETRAYIQRVIGDGGTVTSSSDTNRVMRWLKNNNLLDSTELLYLSNAGLSIRDEAGNLRFVEKVYSLDQNATPNDGTQTTELNQPRLVGGIAPRAKVAASNQNGETRYFTHPAISFAATDAWSVNYCYNFNGTLSSSYAFLSEGSQYRGILLNRSGVNRFGIRNELSDYYLASGNNNFILGKNSIITFVSVGDGKLSVYVNGIIHEVINAVTTIKFNYLLGIANLSNSNGALYAYHIQSGAMSPTQVLAMNNLLRAIYPEIESVQIGTQTWATRNFEAVATPEGNVIANVTENGAVEKIINAADREFSSDTGWWSKNGDTLIDSNVCTFTGLGSLSSTSGNWCLRKDGILNINKYHKITVDVKLISGAGDFYIGFGYQYFIINVTSSSQTYTLIVKSDVSGSRISVGGDSGSVFQIDNISYQELNWSNATEIYDAVYAATSGTTAEKEYAALKEAAMWCYYNNDVNNGAIYGKEYNEYAKRLLKLDMATAGFGWHIPTKTENDLMLSVVGDANKLKMTGTDYFDDDNGTNESGLTLLGTGVRRSDGVFEGLEDLTGYWLDDDEELPTTGLPIRLIKD